MQIIKNAIKSWLLARNCVVSRPPGQFSVDQWKYSSLKRRGVTIRSALDGGAATGGWSKTLLEVFPECKIICVEPRQEAYKDLQDWAQQNRNIVTSDVLLGASETEIEFNESKEQSSVLDMDAGLSFGKKTKARMTTIDKLIHDNKLSTPDLIKLDLQGYELEALSGASESLKQCTFVELEISMFPFQNQQPIFADVVQFMSSAGFRLYDILGLWNRPFDEALAQGDFLFVSNKSNLLNCNQWYKTKANVT